MTHYRTKFRVRLREADQAQHDHEETRGLEMRGKNDAPPAQTDFESTRRWALAALPYTWPSAKKSNPSRTSACWGSGFFGYDCAPSAATSLPEIRLESSMLHLMHLHAWFKIIHMCSDMKDRAAPHPQSKKVNSCFDL